MQTKPRHPRVIDVTEAAALSGFTPAHVRGLAKSGELPIAYEMATPGGKTFRWFLRADVQALVASGIPRPVDLTPA